jgi:hypothetical protein
MKRSEDTMVIDDRTPDNRTDTRPDLRPDARPDGRTDARADIRADVRAKLADKSRSSANRRRVLSLVALVLVLMAAVVIVYYTRSCQSEQKPKMNTPGSVAGLMTQALKANDFAAFQSLLTEQARLQIDSNQFGALQKMNTDKALYGNYALVRLENGRLLMIYLTAPDQDGNYKIQDVKIVPADMNSLFNHAK